MSVANLLDRGQATLMRVMGTAAGRTVTYTRGAQSTTLTAWPGRTLFARQTEEPGASVVWGERDYFFAAASLVLSGVLVVPAKGDRITDPTVLDPASGQPCVFELATPTGEPVWRYSDADRTEIRVHCKRVA